MGPITSVPWLFLSEFRRCINTYMHVQGGSRYYKLFLEKWGIAAFTPIFKFFRIVFRISTINRILAFPQNDLELLIERVVLTIHTWYRNNSENKQVVKFLLVLGREFPILPRIANVFRKSGCCVDHLVHNTLYIFSCEYALREFIRWMVETHAHRASKVEGCEKCRQERRAKLSVLSINRNYRVFFVNQTISRKLVQDLST